MRAADYVVETTTSIAGTSGDGAVTTTAVTNRPRVSTVFGTGAVTVRYVIEDTVNKKFESGIGSFASNVLTRTRPQITWDGTTWDDSTPAALQFGATPTSGNVLIRLAPTAEAQGPVMPCIQSTLAGDSWRDYPFSAGTVLTNGSGGNGALTVDQQLFQAYKLERSGALTGIQLDVTAAVAASGIKWALYSIGYNGLPDQKIVDFNAIDSSTTGIKADTTTGTWAPAGPVWLTPGWYAIGLITNGAVSIRSTLGTQTMLSPFGRKNGYGYGHQVYVAGNYATGLPAAPNFSGGAMVNQQGAPGMLWLGLKVTP